MKINFNRAALAEALGLLTSIVPSRTPKPILRCVKITAGEKDIRICATDLEIGINYLIAGVQIEEPGEPQIEFTLDFNLDPSIIFVDNSQESN